MTRRDEQLAAALSVGLALSRELDDDFVGLWTVPWEIRYAWPSADDAQVRELARMILEALKETDVEFGDLDGDSGEFRPWVVSDPIGVAMSSWARLNRDPNIGEIAWMARRAQ